MRKRSVMSGRQQLQNRVAKRRIGHRADITSSTRKRQSKISREERERARASLHFRLDSPSQTRGGRARFGFEIAATRGK